MLSGFGGGTAAGAACREVDEVHFDMSKSFVIFLFILILGFASFGGLLYVAETMEAPKQPMEEVVPSARFER